MPTMRATLGSAVVAVVTTVAGAAEIGVRPAQAVAVASAAGRVHRRAATGRAADRARIVLPARDARMTAGRVNLAATTAGRTTVRRASRARTRGRHRRS